MKMRSCFIRWICFWIYFWFHLLMLALANEREPVIVRSPTNVSSIVDRNLTLECIVEGSPAPKVSWQKRENTTGRWNQIVRGSTLARFQIKKNGLLFRRLLIGDTGFYRCSAENAKGSQYSDPAFLSVQAPATFVPPRPKNHTVPWGSFLELQCEVIGIPFPHRWWAKNGKAIIDPRTQTYFTDPRLQINATESATYECLAENSHVEGYTNVSQADFVTVIDGFCVNYNAPVCKSFLGSRLVYLKRSEQSVVNRMEILSQTLLDEFRKIGNASCVDRVHEVLCHYNFPLCSSGGKREAKPKDLCRESCLPVRDVFCQSEWTAIRSRFNDSLPDCDRLPSRRLDQNSCFYVDLFNITQDQLTTSCYDGDGSFYRGSVNVTEGGLVCQAWDEQIPHQHSRTSSVYPILEDSGNACRNSGGERERPWCYTMESTVLWQYCNVSQCKKNLQQNSTFPFSSAFNIETAFIVATVTAIPFTFLILVAVIFLRIILPAFRKPKKSSSSEIDFSMLVHIPKPEVDYPFPSLKHLEYQRNSIAYQHDIGQGAFGSLFLADVPCILNNKEPTSVVVKTLLDRAAPEMEQDFIREATVLSRFQHPNVLQVLGVCLVGRPLCVLLEYMPEGDLNGFLQSHGPQHFILRRRSRDSFGSDEPPLSFCEQISIAQQIASGMLYVCEQGFIHRDLATRNCLVGNRLTVKISDFGLAVELTAGEDSYQGSDFEPIPIRWSPLESIVHSHFTHASDVWSFGIVLWEIFSFGMRPYYEMSQEEVVSYVRQGKTLSCPDNTPSQVYDLMRICWSSDPASRPGFETLHQLLCSMEEQSRKGKFGSGM